MTEGTVKWFNDSKGFFDFRGKCDAFVYHTSIQGNGWKSVGHATGGVGGMSRIRRIGFTALLAVGVLVAALVAPAVAIVGEPVPGAEIFLQQQPGDEPIINTGDGGGYCFGGRPECPIGSLEVLPGTLSPPVGITVTVWQYRTPPRAQNGRGVHIIANLGPNGAGPFMKNVKLTLNCPPGAQDAQAYGWDPVQAQWVVSATGSRNGDKITSDVGHFSWYGIGWGPPLPPVPTPASSSWSLGLLALIGAALAAGMTLRRRRSLRTSPRRN